MADPEMGREVGYFMPEPVGGNPTPQSNDVFVSDGGVVFLLDRVTGFDILEFGG